MITRLLLSLWPPWRRLFAGGLLARSGWREARMQKRLVVRPPSGRHNPPQNPRWLQQIDPKCRCSRQARPHPPSARGRAPAIPRKSQRIAFRPSPFRSSISIDALWSFNWRTRYWRLLNRGPAQKHVGEELHRPLALRPHGGPGVAAPPSLPGTGHKPSQAPP